MVLVMVVLCCIGGGDGGDGCIVQWKYCSLDVCVLKLR